MIYGIKYDDTTGAIVLSIMTSDPGGVAAQAEPGFSTMETVGEVENSQSYVSGGVVVNRPVMAVNVDPTTFVINTVFRVDSIPAGTELNHPGGTLAVNDGYFEWSSLEAGAYQFTLHNFPYKEVIIDATVTSL